MLKSSLYLFILLFALIGCKVQQDVSRSLAMDSNTQKLTYSPSRFILIENSTSIYQQNNLGTGYSYTVTPSLPNGLSLHLAKGIIQGTPTTATPEADYIITATSTTVPTEIYSTTLTIEVKEAPPKNLKYSSSLLSVQRGGALTTFIPTVVGNVNSFSLSEPLPSEFTFDASDGSITLNSSATLIPQVLDLTLTAHNTGGATSFNFTLEIRDSAPTAINGLSASYTYIKGQNHPTPPTPVTTPSSEVFYMITPALPAGLSLNTSTGIISGTPTGAFTNTPFTLTASNNEGWVTTSFDLEVIDPISGFAYSSPVTLSNNTPAPIITPAFTGTPIFSVSVTSPDPLPNGLTLNASTGEISGIPSVGIGTLALPQINTFTVEITDSVSSQSTLITFNINYEPIIFSYADTMTFIKDELITPQLAAPTGDPSLIDHYSISTPLPTGLNLDPLTGEISGTTTDAPTEGIYEIKAIHVSNYILASKQVTIKTIEKAPLNINYPNIDSNNILTLPLGEASSETLTYTGGEPTSYSIFPNLPSGLLFDTGTGEIYGTASTPLPPTTFKVTGVNSAGSVFKIFQIEVKIGAPHDLTYANQIFTIGDGSVLTYDLGFAPAPSIVPTTFTINPPLPNGLTINSLGEIKATSPLSPTMFFPPTSYIVTATNESGFTQSNSFTIEIVNGGIGTNPFNYSQYYDSVLMTNVIVVHEGDDVHLSPETPNYTNLTGGKISGWTVQSGTLPTGLNLNSSTGEIYGTPTNAPRELIPQQTATTASTITIRGDNLPLLDNHDETFKIIVLPKAPSFYLSENYYIKSHGVNSIFSVFNGLTRNGGHTAQLENNIGPYPGFRVSSSPVTTNFTVNDSSYYLTHTDTCSDPDIKYNLTLTFENATGIQTTPISVLIADHPGTHTTDKVFNGAGAVQTYSPTYECPPVSPPSSNYFFVGSHPPLLDLNTSNGNLSNNAGLLLKQNVDIKGVRTSFGTTLESESNIKVSTHFEVSNEIKPFLFDFTADGKKDVLLYSAQSLDLLEQKTYGSFSRHPVVNSVATPNNLKSVTYFDASFGKGIIYVDSDGLNAFTTTTPLLQGIFNAPTTDSFILQTGISGDYIHEFNKTTKTMTAYKLEKQTILSFDYIKISFDATYVGAEVIGMKDLSSVITAPIDFKVLNVNGDSFSDYAIAHNTHEICIMELVNEDTVPTTCTTTLDVGAAKTILSMYVENFIGTQDLVVLSQDSTHFYVDIFQNNQDSFASGFTPLNLITTSRTFTDSASLFISDYNQDGMKDIFLHRKILLINSPSSIDMFKMITSPATFSSSPVNLNSSTFNQTPGSLFENNAYNATNINLPDMGTDALLYCHASTGYVAPYTCRIPALIPNLRSN